MIKFRCAIKFRGLILPALRRQCREFSSTQPPEGRNLFPVNFLLLIKFKLLDGGPLSILAKKVADKTLMPDEHQTQVVNDLQKLFELVKDYEPKPSSGVASWFSFGRKKEAKSSDIKGLYIYGSVGGGKTMLMDMFYDCCKVFTLESISATSSSHAI